MKERRRGLGRGLGALIPTSSEGERPVDVFFPAAAPSGASQETSIATIDRPDEAEIESGADVSRETAAGSSESVAVADAAQNDVSEPAVVTSSDTADRSAGAAAETGAESESAPEGSLDGDEPTDTPAETDRAANGDAAAPTDAAPAEATPSAAAQEPDSSTTSEGATVAEPDPTPRDASEAVAERENAPSPADGVPANAEADEVHDDGLVPVPGASFAELPVSSIRPNPRQPRTVFDEGELDELVGSIKEIGVLQPVVVRPATEDPGHYELIMGERRWRATQAAGLDTIPAIVRVTDDEDLLRDALLENLHRSALNPLEEAAAYRQLLDDFGCTHDELATRISRSRPQISNTLRLLRLPPLVQRRVAAGVLSAGHARALLGLSDGAAIERLAQRIVSEGLSVRATEEIVALGVGDEKAPAHRPRAGQRSEAVDALASRLSDRFETRVKVDLGKSKGRVTIEFASVEDLNRILDVMAPEDPGLLRR
ncbi:ParB/RepB/Spo0J family partition protein [Luteimicrobium sp. NPDC057192]|uniref:ParB/RepB/Spo0J family partition protein n=1 Tax=Luteimicrobium sp. NPDC057192 TaxID=3346042 RepID=UPI0036434182